MDLNANTSMKRLYSAGETACNGVHGKNRLASNSLLESLIWAKRAAVQMSQKLADVSLKMPQIDLSEYENYKELKEKYAKMIRDEAEREECCD